MNDNWGGLVGENAETGLISHCSASGDLQGLPADVRYMGGLVGRIEGSPSIVNSFFDVNAGCSNNNLVSCNDLPQH